MTPAVINLCDAAIADASDEARALLCAMGQDRERGYRAALAAALPHYNMCPPWCSLAMNCLECLVSIANLLCVAIRVTHRLDEEKACDLMSFFVQRVRNNYEVLFGGSP